MGNSVEVDIKELVEVARKMENANNRIKNNILKIFEIIKAMESNWYGGRYNKFVDEVNLNIAKLENVLKSINYYRTVLMAGANLYYATVNDGQTYVNMPSDNDSNFTIPHIQITKRTGEFRFKEDEVTAQWNQIKKLFEEIDSITDELKSYLNIDFWNSTANQKYREAFNYELRNI